VDTKQPEPFVYKTQSDKTSPENKLDGKLLERVGRWDDERDDRWDKPVDKRDK